MPAALLAAAGLAACSPSVDLSRPSPSNCAAAFTFAEWLAKGTPLERDPQIAEVRTRRFYEIERAIAADGRSEAEDRSAVAGAAFERDRDLGIRMLKECHAAQDAGGDYARQRPRLAAMVTKLDTSR